MRFERIGVSLHLDRAPTFVSVFVSGPGRKLPGDWIENFVGIEGSATAAKLAMNFSTSSAWSFIFLPDRSLGADC
jgi:hypothetical protein